MGVGLAALVAGCGGAAPVALVPAATSAVTPATSPAPATTPTGRANAPAKRIAYDLPSSVSIYSDLYLGGNVELGWAFVSPRCQKVVTRSVFAKMVRSTSAKYGKQPIRTYIDSFGDDPNKASVSYQYDNVALNHIGEKWVKLAGLWHNDTCVSTKG